MKMSEGNRLHPMAALLSALGTIKDFLLPLIVILISQMVRGTSDPTHIYWRVIPAAAVIVLAIISGVWSWYVFRYGTENGRLFVYRGILFKKKQYIPFERIQSIDLTEGILHRMFGLVRVQVQTAGGSKPEAVLPAVTKLAAAQLQDELRVPRNQERLAEQMEQSMDEDEPREGYGQAVPSGEKDPLSAGPLVSPVKEPGPSRRLPFAKLFIAGLTSGSLGVAFSLLFAFVSQVDELFPNLLPFYYFEQVGFWSILPFLLVILLVMAALVAVVSAILRFANFQITRNGEELIIERGLLEKRRVTLPTKRIQAIRIVEEPLWQPFGLAAVHVESIGYGNEKGESTLLFPLLHKREIASFLMEFTPKFIPLHELTYRKLPAKAWMSYVLPQPLVTAVAAAGLSYWTGWGWIGWILCLLFALLGWWRFKTAGWCMEPEQLILRFRNISRSTVIIPRQRIQSFDLERSPFQIRKGLATIQAIVASGASGAFFRIKGLLVKEGLDILAWFRNWDGPSSEGETKPQQNNPTR